MGQTAVRRRAADATRSHYRSIGAEIRRQREDAGVTLRSLARAAGVSPAYLSEIEAGAAAASLAVLERVAAGLDADLGLRLYPNTGPSLRDRIQVRSIEALLRILHPRWRPSLEVPVYRPARGVIDGVLEDRTGPDVVCVESESDLRRVEQRIRWSREKAESLPSAAVWSAMCEGRSTRPKISRLLLLRYPLEP